MEVFINELSIHRQYNNIEEFTQAVKIFTNIVLKINRSKCKYIFLKKGDFYWYRKAILNEDFRSSLNNIRDKFIKKSFTRIVFDRNNPKNWLDEQIHSNDDNFHSKTLDSNVTGQTLAEISERQIQDSNKKYLLLNFQKSSFSDLTNTIIIKNEDGQITISCVDTIENTIKWIKENCIVKPIVEDTEKFERTSKHFKGTTIYKEKETGNYWYLDTLHTNHYEVFNAQKEHLGEADIEGNLDKSKKDSSKNGKIDI